MLNLKILFSLILLVASSAFAGTWVRIDSGTISFSGKIEQGEFAKFQKIYKSEVHTLLVRSGGGLATEGLLIGEVLARNPALTVIVQGYCFSACAHYLFTAAKTKFLDYGVVGFGLKVPATERDIAFLKLVNVNQELIDKSDRMTQEGLFNFYAPSRAKMNQYGITNVNGEQFLPEVVVQNNIRVFIDRSDSDDSN